MTGRAGVGGLGYGTAEVSMVAGMSVLVGGKESWMADNVSSLMGLTSSADSVPEVLDVCLAVEMS